MNFKKIIYASLLVAIIVLTSSCGSENNNSQPKQIEKDTIAIVDSVPKEIKESIVINRKYDDLAKYISGVNPVEMDSAMIKKDVWKKYASNIQSNWLRMDSTKLQKIIRWSNSELDAFNDSIQTVFYPFSGADFLNAYSFFPSAKQFILVGLEPGGTLPELNASINNDSLSNYFYRMNTSLYAILNFSFFRTQSMSKDFKNTDLNGTIHLILVFMTRTGNSIVDIKPIALKQSGEVVSYSSFEARGKDTLRNKGIEISFVDKDSVIKKTYYFSINLADDPFKKNQSFVNFINNQSQVATYIKSASYLMHKDYFSHIRNLILSKSDFVLQDDSGIPYRFYKDSIWSGSFYGKYSGTIPMFSGFVQKDMQVAYDSIYKPKPLDFGIGYKHRKGESNMQLFKKK